jgi:single-strand DNA-binding protein
MANLNKVMLIGRLTRDPEVRTFANGGKVAWFGFAVNNRKKNQQTGQWEEVPVFIDVSAFNRETRKLADLVEQYLRKGHQAYIEGSLTLDQWDDKTDGSKRSKLKLILNDVQFLEPRADGGMGEGGGRAPRAAAAPTPPRKAAAASNGGGNFGDSYGDEAEPTEPPARGGQEDDIPF